MGINWNYQTTMWIGENRIEDLSLACKELNISNPLFVTEKDLINFNLLNHDEQKYLFKYHLDVYSKLSKYLSKSEKKWLASFI